jgi:hypothetical protein
VAEGLLIGEGAPVAAGQGAGFVGDRAEVAAVGAGLFGREGQGLLLQEGGEGALGQAAGGGGGDLFEGEQIDVQARAGVSESTPGNNFPPLGGQIADFLEFLGAYLGSGHGLPCLGVTPKHVEGHPFPFYGKGLSPAKPVLASLIAARG